MISSPAQAGSLDLTAQNKADVRLDDIEKIHAVTQKFCETAIPR